MHKIHTKELRNYAKKASGFQVWFIKKKELSLHLIIYIVGFQEGYPYPHPHTIYVAQNAKNCRMKPEEFQAQMVMFAFGNALASAKTLYGVSVRKMFANELQLMLLFSKPQLFILARKWLVLAAICSANVMLTDFAQ